MFTNQLISKDIQAQLPEGYIIRPLEVGDYEKGLLDCLAQLTKIGHVTKSDFIRNYDIMKNNGNYYTIVIEDTNVRRVVAAGTIFMEQKFIRGCGVAGHIEDIVVHDSQRGKKLGQRIIDQLKYIAVQLKVYKITLNCSNDNIKFYEKCGFSLKDVQMTLYPDYPPQSPTKSQL